MGTNNTGSSVFQHKSCFRPQTDFSPLPLTLHFCAQPGAKGGFIRAETLFSLNARHPYGFALKQYSFPNIHLVASWLEII